jgi:hypothetical protein
VADAEIYEFWDFHGSDTETDVSLKATLCRQVATMDVSRERTVSVFRVEECDKEARRKQKLFYSEDGERSSSETHINNYQTTRHHILENSSLL